MAAQALMKRGKRAMAIYVKDECLRTSPTGQPQLNELLSHLLDPLKPIDEVDTIDWCRWLVAGGENFDEYGKTVRKYDNATMCGLVWTADFVAYRCRTCGISPSMSLCSNCFLASEHSGHDFNMFRSQAGGACDCGDSNVMKQEGFCPRHGPHQAEKQGAPTELLAVAETMMPRLLWRLIQHLRDKCPAEMRGTYVQSIDAEQYLQFLEQLCDMGAAMRSVITKVINNPTIYSNLSQGQGTSGTSEYFEKSKLHYEAAVESLQATPTPDDFEGIAELDAPLKHSTILDELLFWVVKFEFPQKLVTLLLVLLPNDDYKSAFTKAFVQHYSRVSCALVSSGDRSRISNRVVHISVQLLSPEALARDMVENQALLHIMLGCLNHMIEGVLTTSGLHECRHNTQLVVDCGRDLLREHCYWPIVSDLINVLSHRSVAYKLMSEPKLLMFWFQMISYFQGMNLNQRELDQHVDFEPETYYAAFSAELEICASTMWSMVVHCKTEYNKEHIRNVIAVLLRVLQEWFEGVGVRPYSKPNALQVSFHLPLHRHLAVFLSSGVRNQKMALNDLLPSPDFLQMVMIHLLQVQVAFHEIFAGMWVRNGLQIKGQAMTYVQCHFCNSMVDADIYMLQVCANSLDPDYFLRTVLERFHVLDLLTFAPVEGQKKLGFLESDKQMPMLEGALTFLSLLLGTRTQLGMTDDDIRRLEMVTLLCTSDRTHSQLIDSLPEKCGLSGQVKDFESILKDISDYKAPVFEVGGSMQQGMYVPKDGIWEREFNPVFVLLRSMYKKDFQNSMDRFTTFAKQQKGYKGNGSPWPPFRIPGDVMSEYKNLRKLLHCRTMHAVLFTLLYKALNDKSISDAVIYFTVHLLELALSIPGPSVGKKKIPISEVRTDKSFSNWFAVDNITVNLRTVISQVSVTKQRISPVLTPRDDHDDEESLFTLAPSALSSQSGLVTSSLHRPGMVVIPEGTSSEVINAVQALLEETTHNVDDPQLPSGSGTSASRVRSMGVSANMETKWETVNTEVSESMLTMLVKLHSKLSGKPGSYLPESERLNDSGSSMAGEYDDDCRIGDGPFFIGKVLDKACRQCEENRRTVEQIYADTRPKDHTGDGAKKKKMSDMEERRKKARERQQKVMADFANKQKSFMEKMRQEEEEMASEQDTPDQPTTSRIVEEKLYDCVICNQSTPSTEDKPIGLVALLQATSVLGHRVHTAEAPVLPVSDSMTKHHLSNCATESEARMKSLLLHFEESSCLMSVNIGWQGGVHTQTCGHFVHLDCHKAYVETLKTQAGPTFLINKGEFTCPLCRQLSNSAIPIIPDIGPALVKPLPCGRVEMVRFIAEVMMRRPITPGSNSLTSAMGTVMEDLTKTTDSKYRTCVASHSAESVLLFVCSVLRCNIESEIMQRNGSPCSPLMSLASKKSCLLPLLHVLSMHSKILTTKPYTDVWYHIAGGEDKTSTTLALHQKEVPVLLKDPISLLIQFVLTMPPTMDKEVYWYFVQALYNVVYTQALIKISLKFSEEERSAWRSKVKGQAAPSEYTMETLLGQVIANLYSSGVYEDDSANDPHVPAICCSVWSPQSVESKVQEYCLPYLRSAALLQHHMYGDELPSMQHIEHSHEFRVLCTYLGLTPSVMSVEEGDLVLNGASCVRWLCDSPGTMIQGWCFNLSQFINKDLLSSRMMLSVNPTWYTPKLFVLPKQYDKIFEYYRRRQCLGCNTWPKDPAICLVCGRLLCFKEKCCEQLKKCECVQHSITCGGGLGIYLIVLSCFVVVIRGPRATIWGSVYLDEHGEEDRELKRGKPLYLCEERYNLLQQQWLSHSYDRSCKRWIVHRDQL